MHADSPHDDFHFSISAVFRDWVGGRLDEEGAMEAVGNALAEFRQATGE